MKIKTLTLLAMTALLAASCIKDEPRCSTCDENPDGRGILLSFNDGTDTRSTLQSSEVDYKDVKDVYLYVFNGINGEAECILSEDVDWKGDISQQHWISTDLNAGTYTFLAVGVDDNPDVYGLTANFKGKKLSECIAHYTGTDKNEMATAQIFAGQTTQTVDVEDDVVKVGVTLTRKVAGVLAYLRNIPCKVDFDGAEGGKANVTGIRLVLAQPQNTQMPMWPIATDEAPVYGQEPMNDTEENKILFSYNLAAIGFTEDEDGRYFVKETQEDNILPNTLLYGAYLLPIKNTTQNNTLKLELIGDYIDGTSSQTGKVVKTYTIQNPEGQTDFSLEENKLYSIGKKLSDDSTDGDKPADLSGNILTISVKDWCDHYIPNVFPTVTAPARVVGDYNPENYIFDAPGTTITVTVYPPTGENAAGRHWNMYIVYGDGENEPNKGLNKDEKDWIHIVSKNAEGEITGYTNKLTFSAGSLETKVDLVLNDFAVCRSNLLKETPGNYRYTPEDIEMAKNDYRTAYIVVENDVYSTPYRMKIRQYNTLSIYTGREQGDYWRGVARLDYGCYFDKMTGEAVCEASQSDNEADLGKTLNVYGYTGHYETIWHIFGDVTVEYLDDIPWEGERNTDDAEENDKARFDTSLMGKVKKDIMYYVTQDDSITVLPGDTEGHKWFLPAILEMTDFCKYYQKKDADESGATFGNIANLGWTISYWTSTPVQGYASVNTSRPNNSESTNITIVSYREETARNVQLAARPFRKFLDKDKR